jgi:hypothetical protein
MPLQPDVVLLLVPARCRRGTLVARCAVLSKSKVKVESCVTHLAVSPLVACPTPHGNNANFPHLGILAKPFCSTI